MANIPNYLKKYRITQSRLLYVLTINDRKHKGLLKIGEVFVDNEIADSGDEDVMEQAVRSILDSRKYMRKGDTPIDYDVAFVESTSYDSQCYSAKDIHDVLSNSGVTKETHARDFKDIWFQTDIATVKKAIAAHKAGKKTFNNRDNQVKPTAIVFRPEQEDAIKQTVKHFSDKTGRKFLWNAKMRFGKTLSGLEVTRRLGYKTTLILTHRPVVDDGWRDDFGKIFMSNPEYKYASRTEKESEGGGFDLLIKKVEKNDKKLIFFVSMQYLRLSDLVGGKDDDQMKRNILNYDWDMVMIDEAHEGTESPRGKKVIEKLSKEKTNILSLSGTPFNLLDNFQNDEIYTWDYVMEQQKKAEWDDQNFGDPNPYAVLPRMNIFTFNVPEEIKREHGGEEFSFSKFFKVWTGNEAEDAKYFPDGQKPEGYAAGKFIYEKDVKEFIRQLYKTDNDRNYPFSSKEFRMNFKHTFWLLPYVAEVNAMEALLKEDTIFKHFEIVNVAGDGNVEDSDGSAILDVKNAIKKHEQTITLSCGKLTTGVSVPEWTAVLCLKGSAKTPAANYMQTIFRVQTHAVLGGRQKSDAYVFDFAPDRTLVAVAEASKMAAISASGKKNERLKKTETEEREHLAAFLQLCPVIKEDTASMTEYSTTELFEKLNDVYIERAVRSGYADNSIYDPERLLNLTPEQEKALGDVKDLIGSIPGFKAEPITINKQGFDGVDGADSVHFYYLLTDDKNTPMKPAPSGEANEDGSPKPDGEEWSDFMYPVTEQQPYCYVCNSQKRDGQWGGFSVPVLWKQFTVKKSKSEEQKKREAENKEKRARMSVLRGVAIRIPLLVYGADIEHGKYKEVTIDNFTDMIDDPSWEEFMPQKFTKETFNLLKDCFSGSVFTGAAKRIYSLVKEADDRTIEDRIRRIAKIFSYFHNPDKETVLTPWSVVNMHMGDTVGGWTMYDENYLDDYEEEDNGVKVKAIRDANKPGISEKIFGDSHARILEINSKTGLYPLYMAYSMFKGIKEPEFRKIGLTGERTNQEGDAGYQVQVKNDEEIWKDVLKDNIFVVCRTKMAERITRRTLAGTRDWKMNVVCYRPQVAIDTLVRAGVIKKTDPKLTREGDAYLYHNEDSKTDEVAKECDMIDVLRAAPEMFEESVVKGHDFWKVYSQIPTSKDEDINNMKFTAIVGNPPYQIEDGGGKDKSAKTPIYNKFVASAKKINPNFLSLIMPAKWYSEGRGLDAFRRDMLNDTNIRILCDIPDEHECFERVDIAGGICYFLRDYSYSGDCYVSNIINGTKSCSLRSLNEFPLFLRYTETAKIIRKIISDSQLMMDSLVYESNPFGFRSNFKGDIHKKGHSITLFGSDGLSYMDREAVKDNVDIIDDYKVIMSKASAEHAGQSDKSGRKKIISRLEILPPKTINSESYLLLGTFHKEEEAFALKQYAQTHFFRFLLSSILLTQNIAKSKFMFIPVQDFTNNSDIEWRTSIEEIDKQLYNKYILDSEDVAFINSKIKPW